MHFLGPCNMQKGLSGKWPTKNNAFDSLMGRRDWLSSAKDGDAKLILMSEELRIFNDEVFPSMVG